MQNLIIVAVANDIVFLKREKKLWRWEGRGRGQGGGGVKSQAMLCLRGEGSDQADIREGMDRVYSPHVFLISLILCHLY